MCGSGDRAAAAAAPAAVAPEGMGDRPGSRKVGPTLRGFTAIFVPRSNKYQSLSTPASSPRRGYTGGLSFLSLRLFAHVLCVTRLVIRLPGTST
jgi:hypothetical protein